MLPLADVRVVALEQYGAGPYGSLHLAEMGAQVIKIEQPPEGDVGRYVPPYHDGADSLFFESLNRGKLSVCLSLDDPDGRAVFEDLVRVSDAVYYNLRGDVPAKLKLKYADIAHLNPRVVSCSLSGYGTEGPMAATPGFDYMVQGLAGWMSITGEPGGPPAKTGLSMVDFATGLVAALSTMVGIHAARRDGHGGDCDVALLDTAVSMLNYIATWTLTKGYQAGPVARSGHQTLVPFGNFPTADGWIVVGGSKEKFWQRLAVALGREDLLTDERFASFDQRLAHRDELIPLLDSEFGRANTRTWVRVLTKEGVPCAPVNSVAEALDDPQVRARGLVFEQPHPVFGQVGHVRGPVRFGTDRPVTALAPALGADTVPVLRDLLGYPKERIAELLAGGAVVARAGAESR